MAPQYRLDKGAGRKDAARKEAEAQPVELNPEAKEKLAEYMKQYKWSHLDLVRGADAHGA